MPMAFLAWFAPGSYAAHRRLDPIGLPRRFDQWRRRAEEIERLAEAQGFTVRRVLLDPEHLAAWCEARGTDVNSQARSTLAATLGAQRQREG